MFVASNQCSVVMWFHMSPLVDPMIGQIYIVIQLAHDPAFWIFWSTHFLKPQLSHMAMSAQQLALLTVIRRKELYQAPPQWHDNAIPWWYCIQNIMSFWNLELDTSSDIKTMGKYWLNFVVLTSQDWNKNVLLHDMVHQTSLGESVAADSSPKSAWPYNITTQFYYHTVFIISHTNNWRVK